MKHEKLQVKIPLLLPGVPLAELAGAEITGKFGHKLIEVEGIRHTRHARIIERDLRDKEGIMEAAVSASGMVRIEYDKAKLDETGILKIFRKEGLEIPKCRALSIQNGQNG